MVISSSWSPRHMLVNNFNLFWWWLPDAVVKGYKAMSRLRGQEFHNQLVLFVLGIGGRSVSVCICCCVKNYLQI